MRNRLFNSANEQSRDTPSMARASFMLILSVFGQVVLNLHHAFIWKLNQSICDMHGPILTYDVHQHEHEVLQMRDGAVVIVVILQKFVGVDHDVRHVSVAQQPFAF